MCVAVELDKNKSARSQTCKKDSFLSLLVHKKKSKKIYIEHLKESSLGEYLSFFAFLLF